MKSVQLEFMEARGEEIKAKSDSQKVQESIKQTFEEMFEMLRQIAKTRKRREEWIHDQAENKEEDRTLLIKIHKMNYIISRDVLDQVFAGFGGIEYMEVFSSGGKYHSKIRFQNTNSAIRAFDSLNHRNIYEGGCRLELLRMKDIESFKLEVADEQEPSLEPSKSEFSCDLGEKRISSPSMVDDPNQEEIDAASQGCDSTPQIVYSGEQELPCDFEKSCPLNLGETQNSNPSIVDDQNQEEIDAESQGMLCEFSEGEFDLIDDASQSMDSESGCVEGNESEDGSVEGSVLPCSANEVSNFSMALNPSKCESSKSLIVCIPISNVQLGLESNSLSGVLDSSENLERNLYADKVFAEMTVKKVVSFESKRIVGQSIEYRTLEFGRKCGYLDGDNDMNLVFDPGGINHGLLSSKNSGEGKVSKPQSLWNAHKVFEKMSTKQILLFGPCFELGRIHAPPFLEFNAMASNLGGETVVFISNPSNRDAILYPYDRGKGVMHEDMHIMFQLELILISHGIASLPDTTADLVVHMVLDRKLGFDPRTASLCGGLCGTNSLVNHATCFWKVPIEYGFGVGIDKIFVFDPGISEMGTDCYQISPQVHLWSDGCKGLLVIYNQSAAEIELTAPGVSICFGARSFNITKEGAAACCLLCLSMLVVISGCYIRL